MKALRRNGRVLKSGDRVYVLGNTSGSKYFGEYLGVYRETHGGCTRNLVKVKTGLGVVAWEPKSVHLEV